MVEAPRAISPDLRSPRRPSGPASNHAVVLIEAAVLRGNYRTLQLSQIRAKAPLFGDSGMAYDGRSTTRRCIWIPVTGGSMNLNTPSAVATQDAPQ